MSPLLLKVRTTTPRTCAEELHLIRSTSGNTVSARVAGPASGPGFPILMLETGIRMLPAYTVSAKSGRTKTEDNSRTFSEYQVSYTHVKLCLRLVGSSPELQVFFVPERRRGSTTALPSGPNRQSLRARFLKKPGISRGMSLYGLCTGSATRKAQPGEQVVRAGGLSVNARAVVLHKLHPSPLITTTKMKCFREVDVLTSWRRESPHS